MMLLPIAMTTSSRDAEIDRCHFLGLGLVQRGFALLVHLQMHLMREALRWFLVTYIKVEYLNILGYLSRKKPE